MKHSFYIRADASVEIGSGHVYRCLTLARALLELPHSDVNVCWFAYRAPDFMQRLLHQNRVELVTLPSLFDTKTLLSRGLDFKLIVDHYDLSKDWEQDFVGAGVKLLAFDDMPTRQHAAHIVVDQNRIQAVKDYSSLLESYTELLAGPKYALLRPEFSDPTKRRRRSFSNDHPLSCLLFMGSADASASTLKILEAFSQIPRASVSELHVVVGELNQHVSLIENQARRDSRIHVLRSPLDLSELMNRCDVGIGAGGTTTWERCALGLPTAVLTVAANQVVASQQAHEASLIYHIGADDDLTLGELIDGLNAFFSNREQLRLISERSLLHVDGLGCSRVAKKLFEMP